MVLILAISEPAYGLSLAMTNLKLSGITKFNDKNRLLRTSQ
jgi:hypothetical protein